MEIIYHHVSDTTNTESVEDFFKKMDKRVSLTGKVIVMDNHRAHTSETVTELLASKGAIVVFLPKNCSYFNPIETIWSWVKGKWRNLLLQVKDLNKRHYYWMP
jgi:transposase